MVEDEIQSASNPKKLKNQQLRTQDADKTARLDLEWVLGDPRGRRFVRSIFAFCGEHRQSFHTNAAVMGFNEGARSVALMLKRRMIDQKFSDAVMAAVLLSGEEEKPKNGAGATNCT